MINGQPYWTRNLAQRYDVLSSEIRSDVAIVGGGFTGLSAAKYLSDAGYKVAVLEADIVGKVAGRAAGLINTSAEEDFIDYSKKRGEAAAREIWKIGYDSKSLVREIAKDLECGFEQPGYLYLGKTDETDYLKEEAKCRTDAGFPTSFIETPSTGFSGYDAGILDEDDFVIDPARYCTGLADMLDRNGVRVYEKTKVLHADSGRVYSAHGSVAADKIILAGQNIPKQLAYKSSLIPIETYCFVTEQLTEKQKEDAGLSSRYMLANTGANFFYSRMAGDRLLFGGEFLLRPLAKIFRESKMSSVKKKFHEYFPALEDVRIEYEWSGTIHSSPDKMPSVSRAGDVYLVSGNPGIASAVKSGKIVADMISGSSTNPFAPRNKIKMLFSEIKNPKVALGDLIGLLGF